MRFLKSIIADTSPRGSRSQSLDSPVATTKSRERALDAEASVAGAATEITTGETSRLSVPAQIQGSTTDIGSHVGDASPPVSARGAINQASRDVSRSVDSPPSVSVPVDQSSPSNVVQIPEDLPGSERGSIESGLDSEKVSEPITVVMSQPAVSVTSESEANARKDDPDSRPVLMDARDAQVHSFDFDAAEPPASRVDPAEPRQDTSIDNYGVVFAQADQVIGQSGINGTALSPAGGYTSDQSQAVATTVADHQRHSGSSIEDSRAPAYRAEETRAATFVPPGEGRPAEQGQSAERHAEESASAGTANARQYSQEPAGKTDTKHSANEQDARGNQPQDAKAELADTRFVARRPLDAGSDNSAAKGTPPVSNIADNNRSVSNDAAGSEFSKRSAPARDVASPAQPPANQQPPRTVPARPAPSEVRPAQLMPAQLMSRHRDAVHSGLPRKPPERKPDAPRVRIGQIDVVVESAASVKRRSAPAPAASGLASRHYLRSL